MEKNRRMTIIAIILNSFLLAVKLTGGILSGSLAVLSDAFNSLTDIISSTAIFIAVSWSSKKADDDHPFGHYRAEPLAGVVVAIFAGILGFEVIKNSIGGLFNPIPLTMAYVALAALVITIITKSIMATCYLVYGKKINSPALRAIGVDARNDVLVSSVALAGVIGSFYGMTRLDNIAAMLIGLFILYSGYKIGMENIDYLMGKAPPKEYLEKIKSIVKKVDGVTGINDVRAHYVGNFIHIEVHIEVDKKISTEKSHRIGKEVQAAIQSLDDIDKAFIHIDPR